MNAALSSLGFRVRDHTARGQLYQLLHARVSSSLADPAPSVPHDMVMAELDTLLADIARKQG